MVKARLGLLMLLGAARLSIATAGTSHPLRTCNAADTTLTQTSLVSGAALLVVSMATLPQETALSARASPPRLPHEPVPAPSARVSPHYQPKRDVLRTGSPAHARRVPTGRSRVRPRLCQRWRNAAFSLRRAR